MLREICAAVDAAHTGCPPNKRVERATVAAAAAAAAAGFLAALFVGTTAACLAPTDGGAAGN